MEGIAEPVENLQIDATRLSCFEFTDRRLSHLRNLGELNLS